MAPFSHQQAAGPSRYISTSKVSSSPPTNDNVSTHGRASSLTSPTLLRSRFSPRLSPTASADANNQSIFAAQQDTYPSPANSQNGRNLLAGWGRRKKRAESVPEASVMTEKPLPAVSTPIASRFAHKGSGNHKAYIPHYSKHSESPEHANNIGREMVRTRSQSPSLHSSPGGAGFSVPRYNARGYPIRDPIPDIKIITPRTSGHESPKDTSMPSTPQRPYSGQSSENEDNSPRRPQYPPSSFVNRSSGASSENSPRPGRPDSDASDYSSDQVHMPYGAGISPGVSLYGADSVASLPTHETSMSNVQLAGREQSYAEYLRQHHYESSQGAHSMYYEKGSEEDLRNSGYGHFGFKREGKRIVLNYGLENPGLYAAMGPEDDDDLHNPATYPTHKTGFFGSLLTFRGFTNVGCLALITLILVVLFMGYPIITEYTQGHQTTNGAFGLGGTNATGQVPVLRQPIDPDTPVEAHSKVSLETGETWDLIFSDEFNHPGRSFNPGDDPYWEAEDLHYWPTNNLEWYQPKRLTTRDGSLVITLTKDQYNRRNYTGGMMNTWNKFCFTGGYIEAAVSLPGKSNVQGLWPAIWTMGNLGRAGYGGTTDGMWPYSYDSCDVGTLKNQSMPDGTPEVAFTQGDPSYNMTLSYLSGQRLSACTCPGEKSHPGPTRSDGSYVGRAAPEIDMFEASVSDDKIGEVSLSGQWAPFNPFYGWINQTDLVTVYNSTPSHFNQYRGSIWQQATSLLAQTDQECYTHEKGCFEVFGVEWMPSEGDKNDGYISWLSDGRKAWTLHEGAMAPNTPAGIGQRIVSREPMYMIVNLGISPNFGFIDFEALDLLWPVEMHVDYIRVYQDPKKSRLGCDPADYPTADFIENHKVAFTNPNITTFGQLQEAMPGLEWPKNRLVDQC
ncbi:uncharacterized protein CcaverHIS019_0409950 [Cutaneotrichosporon cavernicola]|uniref:GH16 domain-containing protein n=1 Tax=Cutaneotrichosporon cavernicola TaxID=279322 RepID=A0AA48QWA1_9TREE|nr:uncharacterized protein CcaverHIS019_0409950 [Cutaneotrichosporon cavernicola]BEI92175.1 hypothetical protein CcaverHIS019_0409950 [Cutaneotrichosporon cavernicola]BEI99945.1 hypothetical protein CcaverHIS631_0409880 [Cutaneotrichosporon cavernicola]BEJ07720.1 hypothetical protein CcaverHIS641_0409890 [Cutaneotrichosporon cavernicola]